MDEGRGQERQGGGAHCLKSSFKSTESIKEDHDSSRKLFYIQFFEHVRPSAIFRP